MRVLLDTNILITYITQRQDPYKEEARELVKMCASGALDGYIAFHSVSVIWYVISKLKGREDAREWLDKLCSVVTVVAASHDQVVDAIRNKNFKDFEDCLVESCAARANVERILTANVKDFAHSTVRAVTPVEFLEEMQSRA